MFEVLQFVKKGYSHPESSQAFQFGRTAASRSFRSVVQSRVVLTQAQMAYVHTPPCVLPLCFTFPLALEHIRTATSTPALEHSSAQAYKTDPVTQHRHTSSYTENHPPEFACHNTRVCAQFHAHPRASRTTFTHLQETLGPRPWHLSRSFVLWLGGFIREGLNFG